MPAHVQVRLPGNLSGPLRVPTRRQGPLWGMIGGAVLMALLVLVAGGSDYWAVHQAHFGLVVLGVTCSAGAGAFLWKYSSERTSGALLLVNASGTALSWVFVRNSSMFPLVSEILNTC